MRRRSGKGKTPKRRLPSRRASRIRKVRIVGVIIHETCIRRAGRPGKMYLIPPEVLMKKYLLIFFLCLVPFPPGGSLPR